MSSSSSVSSTSSVRFSSSDATLVAKHLKFAKKLQKLDRDGEGNCAVKPVTKRKRVLEPASESDEEIRPVSKKRQLIISSESEQEEEEVKIQPLKKSEERKRVHKALQQAPTLPKKLKQPEFLRREPTPDFEDAYVLNAPQSSDYFQTIPLMIPSRLESGYSLLSRLGSGLVPWGISERIQLLQSSPQPEEQEPCLMEVGEEDIREEEPLVSPTAQVSPWSPSSSPTPPASPRAPTRKRGRPKKKSNTRPRDSIGRFLPDPSRVKPVIRRKRRTELELLLAHSR